MTSYTKNFPAWHTLKHEIDGREHLPTFNEREIWWCSIGVNVGHEVDGKNESFSRPVLVIRKFNRKLFWGIPLSSKIKDNPHYYRFQFKGREQSALLTHLRLYDSKRMTNKMGQLPLHQFSPILDILIAKLLKQ